MPPPCRWHNPVWHLQSTGAAWTFWTCRLLAMAVSPCLGPINTLQTTDIGIGQASSEISTVRSYSLTCQSGMSQSYWCIVGSDGIRHPCEGFLSSAPPTPTSPLSLSPRLEHRVSCLRRSHICGESWSLLDLLFLLATSIEPKHLLLVRSCRRERVISITIKRGLKHKNCLGESHFCENPISTLLRL